MKLKDIIESAGSANPFVGMASSIDFQIRQLANLEKLIDSATVNVPDKSLAAKVWSAAGAVKGHVSKALSQLELARETLKIRADVPLPPAPSRE